MSHDIPTWDLEEVFGDGLVDVVNHPSHYTSHPSGVECIEIVEHMGFNLGNAIKYIWRADEKGKALEDLAKARFYIDRELKRRNWIAAFDEEVARDVPGFMPPTIGIP